MEANKIIFLVCLIYITCVLTYERLWMKNREISEKKTHVSVYVSVMYYVCCATWSHSPIFGLNCIFWEKEGGRQGGGWWGRGKREERGGERIWELMFVFVEGKLISVVPKHSSGLKKNNIQAVLRWLSNNEKVELYFITCKTDFKASIFLIKGNIPFPNLS